MKSTTVSAAGLALIGTVQAAAIAARQASFDFVCNGRQNPDQDDCPAVYDLFADGTQRFDAPPQPNNMFSFTAGDDKNCQIDITWLDRTYTVTGNQVYNAINGISTTCFNQGTGGSANDIGDRYQIGVRNNPNYVTGGTKKRATTKLIPQGLTIERERSKAVSGSVSKAKRAEGDTGYTYGVYTTYAKPAEFKTYIDVGLGGSSAWEWNESKSVTNSVTLSMSVSAGIEGILSASLGTEISTSTETSSGTAQTMNVVCENDQVANVYFQAYAEIWKGVLTPSGEALTITKPMTTPDGKTDGFYQWDCSQK